MIKNAVGSSSGSASLSGGNSARSRSVVIAALISDRTSNFVPRRRGPLLVGTRPARWRRCRAVLPTTLPQQAEEKFGLTWRQLQKILAAIENRTEIEKELSLQNEADMCLSPRWRASKMNLTRARFLFFVFALWIFLAGRVIF